MATSILGVIQHYQRSIEHSQDDEGRLLHCINKLYKLPIKVEHLQETGIGKTVNSLRKYNGEIGVAAKALVTKWKAMVAAEEEEPVEVHCQSNEDVAAPSNGRESSDDDRSQHQSHNNPLSASAPQPSDRPSSSTTEKEKHHKEHDSRKEGESSSSSERHSSKVKHHKSEKSSENSKSHKHSSRHRSPHKSRDHEASNEQNERPRHRQNDEGSREKGKDKHRSRSEKRALQEEHHSSGGSSGEAKLQQQQQEQHAQKNGEVRDKALKHRISEKHSSSREKEKEKDVSDKPKHHKHNRTKSSSKEDEKSRSKEKEHRSKHKSSSHASSTKPQTSTATTSNVKIEQKRRHSTLDSDNDDATPKAKVTKTQKNVKHKNMEVDGNDGEAEPEDGIDSSMGANFADVLGMLNMPSKKSKKASNALKSPNTSVAKQLTAVSSSGKSSSSGTKHDNAKPTVNNASTSATASLSLSASTSAKGSSKRSPPDMKPALLTSAARLEPLDPSIVLELPTISTNYKPLPVNQTVMDCIFNNSSVASTPKPPPRVNTLTDAEALSHSISSKTMRTKIYSGVKTGQILQVPLLFDLCIRVLQKNIDALEYTGGVPFEVLRPVLERATPHQLLTFEDYNPYLMEDSDVLWQLHVQRTYRNKKRQEMESWREMFLRCQEEEERKLNTLTESIKQSQKIIAAPVRKTQLAFVDSMVKPPRNVQRKQEQYGTKAKPTATPAARVAALSSVTPNAAKVGDARLRVASTVRDTAQVSHTAVRPKKAPLMAKTLQFMRGRHKR